MVVSVELNATAMGSEAGLTVNESVLSEALGVSGAAISELTFTELSHTLTFSLATETTGNGQSDEEIAELVGAQAWSLDVRLERGQGEAFSITAATVTHGIIVTSLAQSVPSQSVLLAALLLCSVR